jgi:ketosteroid isomerase-like protein
MKHGGRLMYRHIVIGIVALLTASTLGAQVPSSVERSLMKLENDWSMAWQKKDAAFLENLFANEYLGTDQDGVTSTKAQELANVSATNVTSFALTDMKVHVYGDTAVVTGVNTIKSTFKGRDMSGAYRFTDVFVKRDGRWQVVATQGSMMAKKSS